MFLISLPNVSKISKIACLSFTDFYKHSFATDHVLLGPCLKYIWCIIRFYHVIFQQQRFNYFLNKSWWFSRRDHSSNISQVIKLLFVSNSKKYIGNNRLFLYRPSYLTTYVCLPRHYNLKVCQFSSAGPCYYNKQLIFSRCHVFHI